MLRNKKVRSNNTQLQMLVDYMSGHQEFANGEFSGPLGQQKMARQWEQVRAMLAEYGPDITVDQWKHSWRDLKKRAREEGSRVRQSRIQTGNVSKWVTQCSNKAFLVSKAQNTSKSKTELTEGYIANFVYIFELKETYCVI